MKVVVVGSGIGGTSAAYHLARDGHEVVLLEKNAALGGHTYNMEIDGEPVDIGFMMFGDSNPNIKEWFRSFGITEADGTTRKRIPMSLTVTSEVPGDVQFSSRAPFRGIAGLFDRRVWRILIDIYKFTMELMTMPVKSGITTREWAAQGKYSSEFFRHYYLAFVAILWTIPKKDVLDLPATQFLRCLKTHSNSLYIPLWQVVLGALGRRTDRPKHLWYYLGSAYLAPFLQFFTEVKNGTVRYNAAVASVEKGGKAVILESGERIECDHVVLATHADESAKMIASWSEAGAQRLMKYAFHKSMMYVHRDPSFLPPVKKVWSSWNVLITHDDQYILTYWMNRIQRLNSKKDVFVTITPHDFTGKKPAEPATISAFRWDHPRLLADCLPQDEILQEEGITLSGAWLGRGFHEDGFVAGRRAAAIVRDAKYAKVPLYEDPGNIPVPAVPKFGVPVSIKLLGASVVGLIGYGIATVVQKKL